MTGEPVPACRTDEVCQHPSGLLDRSTFRAALREHIRKGKQLQLPIR